MTAILAIDFMYQIVVLADCRVSWDPPGFKPQDNLQKIYPVGPTGVFGFSGPVEAAKAVVTGFVASVAGKPLPRSAAGIVSDISESARISYTQLPQGQRGTLELMYVAPDYGNVTLETDNVTFARNLMIKMESPQFLLIAQADAVRLGYAKRFPIANIPLNRDNLLGAGLTPERQRLLIGIAVGAFAPSLASYAPNQVGGLFTIGVATARGVGWWPYGPVGGLELVIEDGRFIQVDHNTDRRIPLRSIVDFDAAKPDAGDLIFQTPKV